MQPGNDHVVILNNQFWKERFGSDPNIVGKKLRMGGELYTVLGVAAPSPSDNGDSKMNVPLAFTPGENIRENRSFLVMGRLKHGVSSGSGQCRNGGDRAAACPDLSEDEFERRDCKRRTAEERLSSASNPSWTLADDGRRRVCAVDRVRQYREFVARVGHRAAEGKLRVRASFAGATRGRIFRQFLIESLSLAVMGGALGVLLAEGILRGLMSLLPRNELGIPYEANPQVNIPVLLFSIAATLICGVFFGCAPAWNAARQNVGDLLKEGGRSSSGGGHHRVRRVLVVAEFALALILVGGAGLMLRSFWNVTQVDLGIRRDHVLTFTVPVQHDRTAKSEQIRAVYNELLQRIGAVPGVSSVALAIGLPAEQAPRLGFSIVGRPAEEDMSKQPQTIFMPVSPGYYKTYGIRLTQGRYLGPQDLAGAPRVAMVSESFVRQYLPGVDPLTQRVKIPEILPDRMPPLGKPVEWQIVGVFHDVQYESHPTAGSAEVDVPFDQSPWPNTTIGIRTFGDPAAVTNSIAAAIRSVNPDYPMTHVRTMDQVVSQSLVSDRFTMIVFGSFAGLALLLAAIGIYGVMTFSVAQSHQEL